MDKQSKHLIKTIDNVYSTCQMIGLPIYPELKLLYIDLFSKFQRNYGTSTTLKILKSFNTDTVSLITERTIVPSSPVWVKRDKGLYPKVLRKIKDLLNEGASSRSILSLMRCYEAINCEVSTDLFTVVNKTSGAKVWSETYSHSFKIFLNNSKFGNSIKDIFNFCRDEYAESHNKSGTHISIKNGVLGPACGCSGKESTLLDDDMISLLGELNDRLTIKYKVKADFGKFRNLLHQTFDIRDIISYNSLFFKSNKDFYPKCKSSKDFPYTGKVALLPDKGGKTRIIAIGNYWIQESLYNLHKVLYKVLGYFSSDCTNDQDRVSPKLKNLTAGRTPVWSLDLTASTDRIPVEPQRDILNHLESGLGDLWINILGSTKFHFNGKPIVYGTGQPMGLYSSWAMLALFNHTIIQYTAWLCKRKFPFRSYGVLGDDVVIWQEQVAKRYRKILNDLSIGISESKSFTPYSEDDPDGNCDSNVAEFAKRIYFKGVEITPISPVQVNVSEKSFDFINLLDWLRRRDYIPSKGLPVAIVFKHGPLRNLKSKRFSRFIIDTCNLWATIRSVQLLDTSGSQDNLVEYERIKLDLDTNSKMPLSSTISKEEILALRKKAMRKQVNELQRIIDTFDEDEQGRLATCEIAPQSNLLYVHWIIQKCLVSASDLLMRLELELADSYFPGSMDPKSDQIQHGIKLEDIEYVPLPKLSDFILGKTDFKERKRLRLEFLNDIWIQREEVKDDLQLSDQQTPPLVNPMAGFDLRDLHSLMEGFQIPE